jgi:hypothetical protein
MCQRTQLSKFVLTAVRTSNPTKKLKILKLCLEKLTPRSKFQLEQLTVRSPSQEIHRLLQNSKVHYRVQKSEPLLPIPNQIHFNIILLSTPRSSELSRATTRFMFHPVFRPSVHPAIIPHFSDLDEIFIHFSFLVYLLRAFCTFKPEV